MALTPIDEDHAQQIQAGKQGRTAGHRFEDDVAQEINSLTWPFHTRHLSNHIFTGPPGELLLNYIARSSGFTTVERATAVSTGALATSDSGAKWLRVNGISLNQTKSDVVLTIYSKPASPYTCGVSVKNCSNQTPTNAQLFFTTARAFCSLLAGTDIDVPGRAVLALRQFCGDDGFRPKDNPAALHNRRTDPRRYFWEEIDADGRAFWQNLLSERQDDVTRLLLQEAYPDDPFVPKFLLHKTRRSHSWLSTELAIYAMDELVDLSRNYSGFNLRSYRVTKGSFPSWRGALRPALRRSSDATRWPATAPKPATVQPTSRLLL